MSEDQTQYLGRVASIGPKLGPRALDGGSYWLAKAEKLEAEIERLKAEIEQMEVESVDWKARFEAICKILEAAMADYYAAQDQVAELREALEFIGTFKKTPGASSPHTCQYCYGSEPNRHQGNCPTSLARQALDNTEAAGDHRPPTIDKPRGITFNTRQAAARYEAMERVCKALLAQGHPCPSKGLWDAIAALEALK